MESRIIPPNIAPDADVRYTPGAILHITFPKGECSTTEEAIRAINRVKSDKKYGEKKKDQRQAAKDQRKQALREDLAHAWGPILERMQHAERVDVDGVLYIPIHAIAACGIARGTLHSRLIRMGLQSSQLPPRNNLDRRWGVTEEVAYKLVTFNPGHRKGWGNNPKRKG